MTHYFDKKFELGFFGMNKFGEATPASMLTLLEETAAEHCFAINHGLYDLIKQDIGWVLASGIMNIDRYPRYRETITIRTWLSEYTSVRGIRENVIYDEQGNVIGRAKGLWVFYDIKKKRPVRIFDEIKNKWSFNREESIRHDIVKKIDAIDTALYSREFKVMYRDVDMNEHVSNLRYLQWVMESMPEAFTDQFYLHSIDGRFLSELKYGDLVKSYTDNDINAESFTHTIKEQSRNKICATAKSVWKARA